MRRKTSSKDGEFASGGGFPLVAFGCATDGSAVIDGFIFDTTSGAWVGTGGVTAKPVVTATDVETLGGKAASILVGGTK